MDESTKQQVFQQLGKANNLLVSVSANPSVDQLSALIGLTLILNKANKHGTAVFSGNIPPAVQFLDPTKTIEKTVDSLRDFIIALDRSKADKLRYKVEDDVVRIFITPYRTTITAKDLKFDQGDFNVDTVIALGVAKREELDQAILAHGKILHDASVMTLSAGQQTSDLGSVNWADPNASSLCEMVFELASSLGQNMIDNQAATSLLTGIVAETDHFRNSKTTPKVMSISAQLMTFGANQQLISAELDKVAEKPAVAGIEQSSEQKAEPDPQPELPKPVDEIQLQPGAGDDQPQEASIQLHDEPSVRPLEQAADVDQFSADALAPEIHIDDVGTMSLKADQVAENTPEPTLPSDDKTPDPAASMGTPGSDGRIMEPPSRGGTFTAAGQSPDQQYGESFNPMNVVAAEQPTLTHNSQPAAPAPIPASTGSLDEIKATLDSLSKPPEPKTGTEAAMAEPFEDQARSIVDKVLQETPYDPSRPEPDMAINSTPMPLEPTQPVVQPPLDTTQTPNDPATSIAGVQLIDPPSDQPALPIAPPVPPPMLPPIPQMQVSPEPTAPSELKLPPL